MSRRDRFEPTDDEETVSSPQPAVPQNGGEETAVSSDAADECTILQSGSDDDQATLAPTDIDFRQQVVRSRSSSPGTSAAPRQFGDYLLLNEIARGGMGVVYRAQQVRLNRIVALKTILAGQLASSADVARFYKEAEAAAQLNHPGIVPVFEVGESAGQHFFSMGYVEGESLADRLRTGPLPQREAARLVADVTDAIAYAHAKGVIHRDLKPANVLIDAHGIPRVTDFGLARQTETDSQLTGSGQILGTPAYMPPEQAAGDARRVGPQADVYSLGAVLYCLLSGRPPFQAASVIDTLRQVIEQEPLGVRQINPAVSADLDAICAKCLMKDPGLRYDSADSLATDLRRFLAGEAVAARSHSVSGRVVSALQRSQFDVQFRGYGRLLYAVAVVIVVTQLVVTWSLWTSQPLWMLPLIYVGQLIAMGLLFRRFRPGSLLPRNPAERQMWAIWCGFIATCGVLGLTNQIIGGGVPSEEYRVFPAFAAVSGLAFCFLGSTYWGRCYLLATMFFGLPFVMLSSMPWAPIEFGVAWSIALVIIGRRLSELAAEHENEGSSGENGERSR